MIVCRSAIVLLVCFGHLSMVVAFGIRNSESVRKYRCILWSTFKLTGFLPVFSNHLKNCHNCWSRCMTYALKWPTYPKVNEKLTLNLLLTCWQINRCDTSIYWNRHRCHWRNWHSAQVLHVNYTNLFLFLMSHKLESSNIFAMVIFLVFTIDAIWFF